MNKEQFSNRLEELSTTLAGQGERVAALFEQSCEAVYALDADAAELAIDADDEIDRIDVAIEQTSVTILSDAMGSSPGLTPLHLRRILTMVKINNELERAADACVSIAMQVNELEKTNQKIPSTFRMLTNSVAGILRDVVRCYVQRDPKLAKIVLDSEDTVVAFKSQLLRDAEQKIAAGTMEVDLAFCLHELSNQCERIADYATNIAEQVIYSVTGTIVRHTDAGWIELPKEP